MNRIKGLVLLEFILVIVIVGILFGLLAPIMRVSLDAFFSISASQDAVHEANVAMDRMTREIRHIAPLGISSFSSSSLTFTDINSEIIAYSQNGAVLERNGNALVSNLSPVGGVAFTYFDANGVETAVASAIRKISIVLQVDTPYGSHRLQSLAEVRNVN